MFCYATYIVYVYYDCIILLLKYISFYIQLHCKWNCTPYYIYIQGASTPTSYWRIQCISSCQDCQQKSCTMFIIIMCIVLHCVISNGPTPRYVYCPQLYLWVLDATLHTLNRCTLGHFPPVQLWNVLTIPTRNSLATDVCSFLSAATKAKELMDPYIQVWRQRTCTIASYRKEHLATKDYIETYSDLERSKQ